MSIEFTQSPRIDASPLHFNAWGTASPRLLLIHGLGDGSFVWNALVDRLTAAYSGIAVDLRGHGDSPHDEERRYCASAHAADVGTLLDELELERIVLVGHSLGAEVAIRVAAAAHPAVVRGLVIVDGGPELEIRAARALQRDMALLPHRYERMEDFEKILEERHPLALAQTLRDYATSALQPVAQEGWALKFDPAVITHLDTHDSSAIWTALRRVRCPKLLVRGIASSFLSERKALEVTRLLPACRLVTVPNAGHSVPLDNPEGLHCAITPFLAEVSTSHRASED